MGRTSPDNRPGWLQVRVRCVTCGGGWFDWMPQGATLGTLRAAVADIDCPNCRRDDAALAAEAVLAAEIAMQESAP